MISHAVLLAAGRGSRLGELTQNQPKPLLVVGGRPLIVHILDGLRSAGIEDIAIVTGYLGAALESELGNGESAGLRIHYFRQQQLDGTARAVALAREWLAGEPFFFGWGDILVRRENYRNVLRAARLADGALAVNTVDDPTTGAAVYVDGAGFVTRLVEKPPPGTSSTNWNHAGFGVLSPAIWPEIDRLVPSDRGEFELPQAIANLVTSGARIRAVPVEGDWFDIGTPEELERARAAWSR